MNPETAPVKGQSDSQNAETIQTTCENGTKENHKGILYVVATPIGNLSDLTFRALEVLKQVDWIACEDTRRTLKLLSHYGIHKPFITIFGAKEKKETPRILHLLKGERSIALLSDAGTPCLSDPGSFLVKKAREEGLRVDVVPGVSALSSAVSLSGFCEDGFVFLGFLHRRKSRLKAELLKAKEQGLPIIFFESIHRIHQTLTLASEVLGEECECWIGRELTKKFEEQIGGKLSEVLKKIESKKMLGEITGILKP